MKIRFGPPTIPVETTMPAGVVVGEVVMVCVSLGG